MAIRRRFRSRSSERPHRVPQRRKLALSLCIAMAIVGTAAAGEREDWYLAAHNHRDTGLSVLVVTADDGGRWIRVSDLRLLDLDVPRVPTRTHAGELFIPLSSLPLGIDIDAVGGRLHLLDGGHRAPTPAEDLIVDIVVNGETLGEPQVARRQDEDVLLSRQTLAAARLTPPTENAGDWTPVSALAGTHYVLDERRMRLDITARPEHFTATRLRLGDPQGEQSIVRARAPLSAIVGYDLGVGRTAEGAQRSSLLLDAGVAGGHSSCRNRQLWRSGVSWSRLDSTCFIDWPERRLSVAIGDGISRDSSLSGAVRYGGFRVGTDFDLQPQLRTQPLLGVQGTARLPSILEIWSQQQLAFRGELPPGPFQVDGIPAQTGRGSLEAVVTDALGRQVVLSAPVYSDPNLLRSGLSDWSFEAGRLRENFLTDDDRYADPFALFSWRRGLSSFWTVEARAEWQASHHLLGLTNYLRLGHLGVAELSAARSDADGVAGQGWAIGYGYEGIHWTVGFRHAAYDAGYRDLAYPLAGTAPARDVQANAGMRIGRASLSIGAILHDSRTDGEQRLARAGLSVPLGRGFINITAFRPLQPAGDTIYSAIFTLPLEGQRSASAWVNGDAHGLDPGASLQRSLPIGPGYGYRLLHEESAFGPRSIAEGTLRTRATQWSASLQQSQAGTDVRLGAAGALVATGDGAFVTTDDGGSFALVDLPQGDARVLREHQFAASTRGDGKALVSGLRPFEPNRLDVDSSSLAMSSRLDRTDLEVTPGRRQVVIADFGARHVVPLTLQVKTGAGSAIPAGAVAHWPDTTAQVGYDGLLYLELEDTTKDIDLTWQDRRCTIPASALPARPDPAQLYEVTCR